MTSSLNILSVSAASAQAAAVYLSDDRLMGWHISETAARSAPDAGGKIQEWINEFHPQVVVLERFTKESRKGKKARAAIEAMKRTVVANKLLLVSIPRPNHHKNIYQEAVELVGRYPDIAPYLITGRKIYENEHRNMRLFEALALADAVRRSGTLGLAAAMG